MSQSVNRPDNQGLICRYTDKAIVLMSYVFALLAIGAFVQFIYTSETALEILSRINSGRDEHRLLLYGSCAVWAAVFIDFLLQLRAFLQDRAAIVVNEHGIAGLHGGLWREIAWEDLYEIEIRKKHLRFVRRPHNAFTELAFALHAGGWSRFRLGEYCIHVLSKRIDGDRQEILRAVSRYRPDLL